MRRAAAWFLLFFLLGGEPAAAAEPLLMGGTGAAKETLRHLAILYSKKSSDIRAEVVPNLGSAGGIRAVAEGAIALAVTSRRLKPEEEARGLAIVEWAKTPFGLATSNRSPQGLFSAKAAAFFAAANSTWADGQPVRPVLRPKNDTDTALLGALFPGMAQALETLRARADVPTALTDQDNAEVAEKILGSIAGAAFNQVKMELRQLRFVPIDGAAVSLENFERGSYPYGKTFYIVTRSNPPPAVASFLEFLWSPEGREALRAAGALLAADPRAR